MIIVLGTGRCGTSTIARLLHTKLNITMGGRFRKPDASNPQGYFEDLDFRDLNHSKLSGQCNNFPQKLEALISSRRGLWGIKDPRICNLWKEYRKYDAQYIVCIRQLQLIIKSMMINYGWTGEECKQLIWARTQGMNRLLVGRDALRIDFSNKRGDTELTNLLQRFLT